MCANIYSVYSLPLLTGNVNCLVKVSFFAIFTNSVQSQHVLQSINFFLTMDIINHLSNVFTTMALIPCEDSWCDSDFLVRVLLFSQMTSLMTILEDYFNWKGNLKPCGTAV